MLGGNCGGVGGGGVGGGVGGGLLMNGGSGGVAVDLTSPGNAASTANGVMTGESRMYNGFSF